MKIEESFHSPLGTATTLSLTAVSWKCPHTIFKMKNLSHGEEGGKLDSEMKADMKNNGFGISN